MYSKALERASELASSFVVKFEEKRNMKSEYLLASSEEELRGVEYQTEEKKHSSSHVFISPEVTSFTIYAKAGGRPAVTDCLGSVLLVDAHCMLYGGAFLHK